MPRVDFILYLFYYFIYWKDKFTERGGKTGTQSSSVHWLMFPSGCQQGHCTRLGLSLGGSLTLILLFPSVTTEIWNANGTVKTWSSTYKGWQSQIQDESETPQSQFQEPRSRGPSPWGTVLKQCPSSALPCSIYHQGVAVSFKKPTKFLKYTLIVLIMFLMSAMPF